MLSLAPSRATRVLADTNGDKPMSAQLQNVLIVCVMLGFALMEFVSRRYQATVRATSTAAAAAACSRCACLAPCFSGWSC